MSNDASEFPRLPQQGTPGPNPPKPKKSSSMWQTLLYFPHLSFAGGALALVFVFAAIVWMVTGKLWMAGLVLLLYPAIVVPLFLHVLGKEGDVANIKAKPPSKTVVAEKEVVVEKSATSSSSAKTTSSGGAGMLFLIVLLLTVLAVIAYKQSWLSEGPHHFDGQAKQSRPVRNFNPGIVCPGAWKKEPFLNYANTRREYIVVDLPEGCSSAEITLPLFWNSWRHQAAENTPRDCWVSFTYSSMTQWEPVACDDNRMTSNAWTSHEVRVQGKGRLVFYRNS